MHIPRVVFPEPDSPTTAKVSLCPIVIDTLSTACRAPLFFSFDRILNLGNRARMLSRFGKIFTRFFASTRGDSMVTCSVDARFSPRGKLSTSRDVNYLFHFPKENNEHCGRRRFRTALVNPCMLQ